MNEKLRKLILNKNHKEISKIIISKTTKPSLEYKEIKLTEKDVESLKIYTKEIARECLNNNYSIPDEILEISRILGNNHMQELRNLIVNFIISQETAELSLFLSNNFTNLQSLERIYSELEFIIIKISDKHNNLEEFKITHQILLRLIIMVKQKICDYFFIADADNESYTMGFSYSLKFEKNLKPYFQENLCCNLNNCIHTRMLSSVFVPHITKFFMFYLEPFKNNRYNQSKCELNIIETFLLFFREVGQIFDKTQYLDDASVYNEFVICVDEILQFLLKNIAISTKIHPSVIVLNTIIYVYETIQDLVMKIKSKADISIRFNSLAEVQRLEKLQMSKFEKMISDKFIKCKLYKNGVCLLVSIYKEVLEFIVNDGLCEDTKYVIFESISTTFFQKLCLLKINQSIATKMLSDLNDLKTLLIEKGCSLNSLKMIEMYLKIFIHPVDDLKSFIVNFEAVSNGTFSFVQILKALKNKRTEELFLLYKKQKNIK